MTIDRKEEKKKIDFQQNVNIKQTKKYQEEEIVTLFLNIAS